MVEGWVLVDVVAVGFAAVACVGVAVVGTWVGRGAGFIFLIFS